MQFTRIAQKSYSAVGKQSRIFNFVWEMKFEIKGWKAHIIYFTCMELVCQEYYNANMSDLKLTPHLPPKYFVNKSIDQDI